jgi:NADH-quinone oxidoreductase subunit J
MPRCTIQNPKSKIQNGAVRLTGWEMAFFYALGIWALLMGVFVVTARNPVHSAMALISTLVSVAGLFVLLHAEFLAGVQVLVYVGGVMVLFLFVIMLVSLEREEAGGARLYTKQAIPAIILAGLLAAAFLVAAGYARPRLSPPPEQARGRTETVATSSGSRISRDTEEVGSDLYNRAALPFEIASLVLLVAIVGSVLLARGRKQERIFD